MKYMYSILFVTGFLGLIGCGNDEEGRTKTIVSKSAEWSMLVDGDLVEGDKMEIRDTEENGKILKIYQSGGINGVAFYFGTETPKVKEYETGVGQFYARHFFADTLSSIDGYKLIITKMNSDSLVATFVLGITQSSVVLDYEITKGLIKAKLK